MPKVDKDIPQTMVSEPLFRQVTATYRRNGRQLDRANGLLRDVLAQAELPAHLKSRVSNYVARVHIELTAIRSPPVDPATP